MKLVRLLAPLLFLLALISAPLWAQAPPFMPTPVVAFVNNGSTWQPWAAGTGANPVAATPLSVALYCQITTGGQWTPCNPNNSGNGVVSINGTAGAFTFEGGGVNCSTTTCTFANSGGTVYDFLATPSSWPAWLQPTVTNPTTAPSLAVTATAIPNSALAFDSMSINAVLCTLGQACTVLDGTGTVTSVEVTVPPWLTVAGVPITTNGTIAIGAATEPAKYFLASPATATGAISARPIVPSDIPILNQNTTGQAGSVETILGLITAGTNMTIMGEGTAAYPFVLNSAGSGGVALSYPGIVYATSSTTGNIATSAQIQAGIGADVYDFYGAANDVQALSLQRANNLSDVYSVATARTNLGLGTLATQNSTAISVTGGSLTGVTVNGVTLTTGGPATEYLSAAGTYTTPAGSGGGGISTVVANNGLTESISGTTLTLGLGAITPTSVMGVTLQTTGVATAYLNAAGQYTTPAGTGGGLTDPGANGFVYRTALDTTSPATYTELETLQAADTVNNSAIGWHLGSGGAATLPTPTAGVWYTVYGASDILEESHNGDAYAPANPMSCQPGITNGPNAIPAGTYPNTICRNESGHIWNLTSIKCVSDTGASTCNATNGAGTALLTGAITGTPTYASGTQSATITLASGDYLMVTFVADGTSHQIGIDVAGWY